MRLFVAINLPPAERERAWAATQWLRESGLPVRWVAAEAYHLTLKFLGEVAEPRVPAIGAALGAAVAGRKPFTLELGGGGVFPDRRRPSVWWLGVSHDPELGTLQQAAERELAAVGFPPDERAYAPHLTIGRTHRHGGGGALRGAAARLHEIAYRGTITVDSLDLMQSQLASSGARYRRLRAAILGG